MNARPTLRLYDGGALRPHYIAVYARPRVDPAVEHIDRCRPIAVFGAHEMEDALDFAENLSRDRHEFDLLNRPDAEVLVVSDHHGRKLGQYDLVWLVPKDERRRVSWWLRMFGWR